MDRIVEWILAPYNYKSFVQDKALLKETTPAQSEDVDFRSKHDILHSMVLEAHVEKSKNKIVSENKKEKISTNIFRPDNFTQFIGQNKAKDILNKYLSYSKKHKRVIPHILIHGNAGCGKTTLARIVANEAKVQFRELVLSTVDFESIINIIMELDGGILFIDEIHSIERNNAEKLYSLMEDFTYNGERIKPFTLIGATTEVGEIIKNRKPFYDRFKAIIELEEYSSTDIFHILSEYRKRKFTNEKITKTTLLELANNARLTPRIGIRLLDATVYFQGNSKEVLDNFGYIYNGYTNKDIKVLRYLSKHKKCGVDNLCSYLNISKMTYLYEIEPYLLATEMIYRESSGRKISDRGMELLAKFG